MQDKKLSLPGNKLTGIHYNAIKAFIDQFFEEWVPKVKDGKPVTTIGIWPSGKKGPNQHYEAKKINTKDKKELTEFTDKKLNEYLNPGPTEIPLTGSLRVTEILKDNAINRELRAPEMFFENEIDKALEYQSYFPEYRKNAEHLKYWSILQDYIDFLTEKSQENKTTIKKTVSEITELSQLFEKISHYNYIINLLAENTLIDPVTKVWIDNKKGNYSHIIAILKDLKIKKYYKKEIPTIRNQTYQTIALNTFSKRVKIDAVTKAKPTNFVLDFIPYADTLP